MRQRRRESTAGFTLIEVMVVLAIIGLIAAAVAANIMGAFTDAKKKAAQLQVRNTATAANRYMLQHGGDCPTLEALIAEKAFSSAPKDPWKKALHLRCPGEHDSDATDVWSSGPDGIDGNADDVGSWMQ